MWSRLQASGFVPLDRAGEVADLTVGAPDLLPRHDVVKDFAQAGRYGTQLRSAYTVGQFDGPQTLVDNLPGKVDVGVVLEDELPGDEEQPSLTIGQITIDLSKQEILVNSQWVHLTRNESRIMYCLARSAGKVVSQETLKQNVWGGESEYIDNSALKRYIYQLRSKLGDTSEPPKFIVNEHGIGYRLIKPE